jgi:hypothetical protein
MKNFYGASSLFIGVRGQFQENASIRPLRFFRGDAYPLLRSEGDVFLPEFEIIFVESDRRSQLASPRS